MNPNLEKLYQIGLKNERYIIGLMSGTSLDGLDIAYCKVKASGLDTEIEVVQFETYSFNDDTKNKIRKVFAKETVDFTYLTALNEWIGNLHGNLINQFLQKHKIPSENVDVIASHGQTVLHAPKHQHQMEEFPNATLQIGDGDHIAAVTNIITISDFRQKHLAHGGEGAPLAVYGDLLIFSKLGEDRIMLNMGGIGNFTYLPGDGSDDKVFVTDTGPGNTLMDAWMKEYFGLAYDEDGKMANEGNVIPSMLQELKAHYFFKLSFPKTTGPEVFNIQYVKESLEKIGLKDWKHEDIMATLNLFSAETISGAIGEVIGTSNFQVYMSGGGAHNMVLVNSLKNLLPNCTFRLSDEVGIQGDAKEAVLFAVLANETLAGSSIDFGDRQGIPSVCMGKISFPN
jgi:anhydro-N-acetylmuramic acid kinase